MWMAAAIPSRSSDTPPIRCGATKSVRRTGSSAIASLSTRVPTTYSGKTYRPWCSCQIAGRVSSTEVGLQLHLFAALSVTTNVGYNNTTYLKDFTSPGGIPINTKGDHPNGSPPAWVYSVSPQYDFEVFGGRPLFIRLDLSGSSQGRVTQALGGMPPVAGNGLLSARIGTQIGRAEVQIFANNVTNRAPDLALFSGGLSGGLQNAFWTNTTVRPRTVGVFVTYRR
jgi:hypothetical protein